ncbi:MAG TPA: PH domain-containing protein [Actinotalea sp.]|nr:PH domain-containing protein [Actinotalea sp.]
MHPVTPLVRGWKILAVLLVIGFQQLDFNPANAAEVVDRVGLGGIGLVVLVVAALGFGYAALAWRMTRYAVGEETVHLASGVLFRQQRAARLDRIQAIDTAQPLLARMLGLTELKIEVAGGQDSAVRLSFLRDEEAQDLRNELLARAAGLDRSGPDGAALPAAAAPERELVHVPPGRLLESLARSVGTLIALLVLIGAVTAVVVTREPAVIFSLIPVVIGVVGAVWARFTREFNFRLAQSPDGIRLRHGLLEARAQTVPPGRVQAVRISQPLLWRGRDWWRVEVNVAGYVQQGERQVDTVLLSVGDRDEALVALWLVLPDLGVPEARQVLDEALEGRTTDRGFVVSPPPAVWLDPVSWRRNGFLVTERALLVRTGRLFRRLVVVPHEKTQSIALRQGPWQRRLGVASVVLHSTPGPVVPLVPHVSESDAGHLVTEQAGRARQARATATPDRWMSAPAPGLQPSAPQLAPPPPLPAPPPPVPPGPPPPPPSDR